MCQRLRFAALSLGLIAAAGCASLPEPVAVRGQSPSAGDPGQKADGWQTRVEKKEDRQKAETGKDEDRKDKKDEKDKDEKKKAKGPPKTLFEWAIGPEVEEDDQEEEDVIVTDRPDFTEASSTVGLGRVQLEAGYTYFRDRSGGMKTVTQTYPEALLRIGVLADWFELRLGQTYVRGRTTASGVPADRLSGLSDLYVGTKLWLTEQKCHLPEMALVLQATVPCGADAVTADRVLPGFNFLYGWDVIPDLLSAGGSLGANKAVDDVGHSFVVVHQSFTLGYTLTEQLGAYTEWFALYPTSAIAPDVGAEHYANGGFTYKVTPDFQLDVRAGWGLNRRATDFFAGAGFAVRY